MGLLRTVRRSLRKWRTLVFIVGLFLLVQILLTFETGTSSVEEHPLKKSNSVHRDEDNIRQMANAMLEGKESLIGINRRALDVLNPKDPRIREAFLQQLSQHDQAGILEEETQNKANQLEVMEPNGPNDYHPNEYEFDELAKDDVEYKPTCEITLTDANSAISRANSNACKQEIADVACKLQNETLFPKSIPRYCKLDPKHASSAPVPSLYPENAPLARICYMLVVHGRAFRQFSRLLKTIYHRDHFYYIHVDKRSDFLLREIVRETEKYPNVKVTSWRMATIWGGSSLLQMLLHAISDALYVWKQWDFFVNLSALDFPVETGDNLAKYLATYRSKNFMKSHGRDDAKFIQKQGLNKVFVECEQHMWRLGPRTLPEGITISGGSDWVALNRELCQYAVKGNDQLLSDLKYWYKYTLLPAESFFHTLTKNSEQCDTFVDNNLRVTNWNRARGCKCQYKHIVDWCGCSPNDFYPSDLGRLKTTRPVFFARKFEEIVNQEVVNHLDFKLYGQYPPGTPSLHSYWENVYDRLDGPTSVRDVMLTQYTAYARMGLSDVNRQSRDKVRELGVEGVGLTNCDLRFNKLVQVEVHKRDEELVGYLATMDAGWLSSRDGSERGVAESDQSFVRVQALLTPHQPLRIIDPASALAGRLQSALVGTEWDVKELVLRDWGGVIGPESDCHLVARWRRGDDDFVVTVVVIDPLNVVNDYNDFRTPTKSAGVTETPLSLRKPMRTGRWVARFYVQRQFHKACAELEFHVVPLQFKDGAEGDGRLKSINAGILDDSQVNSANRNLYSIRTTLNLVRDQRLANQIAANSEHVTGAPLRAWVDHTVAGAWAVKDVCLVSMGNRTAWGSTGCTHPRLTPPNRCEHMSWSSFSPDPKSHLGVVKRNGRIR